MDKLAVDILQKYHNAKLREDKDRAVGKKCFEYTNNWVGGELGQWESNIRSSLEGKPALSFNEIRKFVNRICGTQTGAKLDTKCYPRDDESDWITAEILTDLVKYVKDCNEAEMHISRAFRDMILWKGFVKVEWSDEFDPLGEIAIKHIDARRVYVLGNPTRYDLLDAEGVIEELPMTYDDLLALAPEKADELQTVKREDDETGFAKEYDYMPPGGTDPSDVYDEQEKKYIVLRCQKFQYRDAFLFENASTGEKFVAPEDSKQREIAKELFAVQGIAVKEIQKKIKKVKRVLTCGPVLLREEWSPYNHNRFDIVRFAAYLDGGKVTGVVQDLLDPQDEKNKRRSQIVHILNSSPRNNHFAKKGAFDDVEQAAKDIGGINKIIEVNGNLNEVLKPIESNLSAIPAIINLEMQSTQDMKDISGLHDAALGQVPEGVKSGRGIQQLQLPSETIINEIFDHYVLSLKLISRLVVSLIQQYYTEEKKIRILGDYYSKYIPENEQVQKLMNAGVVKFEDGAKLVTINKQVLDKRLNDVTVGKYDVVIDVVAFNPTMRRAKYMDMLNAKSMGAPVKWSTIFNFYDGPGKMELIRDAQEAEAFMGQTGVPPQLSQGPQQANLPVETDLMGNFAGARQ